MGVLTRIALAPMVFDTLCLVHMCIYVSGAQAADDMEEDWIEADDNATSGSAVGPPFVLYASVLHQLAAERYHGNPTRDNSVEGGYFIHILQGTLCVFHVCLRAKQLDKCRPIDAHTTFLLSNLHVSPLLKVTP